MGSSRTALITAKSAVTTPMPRLSVRIVIPATNPPRRRLRMAYRKSCMSVIVVSACFGTTFVVRSASGDYAVIAVKRTHVIESSERVGVRLASPPGGWSGNRAPREVRHGGSVDDLALG